MLCSNSTKPACRTCNASSLRMYLTACILQDPGLAPPVGQCKLLRVWPFSQGEMHLEPPGAKSVGEERVWPPPTSASQAHDFRQGPLAVLEGERSIVVWWVWNLKRCPHTWALVIFCQTCMLSRNTVAASQGHSVSRTEREENKITL